MQSNRVSRSSAAQCGCRKRQELPPRHRLAAETAQVRRGELAVDQLDVLCRAALDQARERRLGGVGLAAEHRLAEEHAARAARRRGRRPARRARQIS